MKKKRSEIKKSESNSNAKNGEGGGDNACACNNNASPPNDKHHNQSAPCSNLAAAIAQEIFPTVVAEESTAKDLGHAVENGESTGRMNSPSSNAAVSESGKKSKSEIRKIENNPPSTQQRQLQPSPRDQPLLGYMIHRYLIEERMKKRDAEAANGDLSFATTTSTKKKKSRKKKSKKKSGALSIENGEGENSYVEKQHDVWEENEYQRSSVGTAVEAGGTPPASHSSAIDENNSIPMVGHMSGEDGFDTRSQASTPCTNLLPSLESMSFGTRQKNKPTNYRSAGLDRLLDSLIDSGESSSILYAGATNHKSGGERNIETFSAYLRRKFDSHLEQTNLQLRMQQQKKEKIKGGGGRGGEGVSTNSAAAAAIIPSSLDCTKKNSTMCGSMELKDILPTISFKDVNDLVEKSIDCRKCRTSVTSHLRNLTKDNYLSSHEGVEMELRTRTSTMTKDPVIILNERSASIHCSTSSPTAVSVAKKGHGLSIPVSGMFSDDIESAFNYFNMDMDEVDLETGEGGDSIGIAGGNCTIAVTPQSSSFHLELRPIPQANAAGYLQVGSLSGKDKGEKSTSVKEYPMMTCDIIDLVKFILLPCGLPEKALGEDESNDPSEGYALSGKELSTIANEAVRLMTPIRSKIFMANQSMCSIKEIMEEAENSNSRSHLDSKTSSLLREADAKIEIVFKQLGEVMLQFFKLISFVGWSSKRGPNLLRFGQCLWKRYNEALGSLIEPTLRHRGSVLQASARERQVPLACFDTVVRNSLHELVKAKTTVLSLLLLDVNAIIDGKKGSIPNALAEICVLQAVRQLVELPKMVSVDDIFPDQESEELLQQLIAARIHLSQSTINCVLCDDIITKAKEQRDTLDVLCRTMRKIIIAMEDFAPETKIEFLLRGYESHEFSYYDLVRSHNSLCETDAGFEARNATLLLNISFNLIMQWMILLCSRQYHESSSESLAVPSRLEKWLASTPGTKFHNFMPDTKEEKECDGGGGERRVSSILAGLLYRWLEARCSEWHAEVTRDELLQSVDMEETTLLNEESSKVGKKKKSKRKFGGKKEIVEKNESGGRISTSVVEQHLVAASSDETKHNTVEESINIQEGTNMRIDDGFDIDDASSPLGIALERVPQREKCNTENEYNPGVGVVDGTLFVAAEVYLVNRLKMILAAPDVHLVA